MFNYWFNEKVINKLDKFIDSYSESFLKLFRDSWVTNKYIIEENYIQK
jgi:lipopolysaccharide biosynthesis protein